MADSSEISSLYPPPPPYYKFFTSDNVQKYNKLRKDGINDDDISEIPNIKFLVHPKHPVKKQYRSFGDLWWFKDKQVGLKESGIEQIYGDSDQISKYVNKNKGNKEETEKEEEEDDDEDEEVITKVRINELKKMTKSLLLNFLELVGLLSKNPKLASQKIDNIRTILVNIHHLLNSYRSHQSRETLILSMQKKLLETQESICEIKNTCSKVEDKLKLLVEQLQKTQKVESPLEVNNTIINPKKAIKHIPKSLRNEAIESLLRQQ